MSLKYTHRFVSHIFRFVLLEPFRWLEMVVFNSRINKHELSEDPIFVLGHWRSGTSHLQSLLRLDPKTTSIGIYSSIFSGSFLLTSSIIKPMAQGIAQLFGLKYILQRTPLDMDYPADLDTGLCFLPNPYSYTWGYIFPKNFRIHMENSVFNDDPVLTSKWLDDYDYLIKKISYISKGKRVIVKSPGDTGRIKFLKERYPNARFVYIHRDHHEVYHSNVFLWNMIRKNFCLQRLSDIQIHQEIVETYRDLMNRYINQRDILDEKQLVEVSFKKLRTEPVKVIEKIYSVLELGRVPIEEIEPHIVKNESYKSNTYHTPKELADELDQEWDFLLGFNPKDI